MLGMFEIASNALGPGAPVLDVVGEASLPRIEIDRGDPLAALHQRDRDMHGDRGLPRSALFVGNNNHADRPRRN